MAIVIRYESDRVGIVAEVLAQIPVTQMSVKRARIIIRSQQKSRIAPFALGIAHGQLTFELKCIREEKCSIHAGGSLISSINESIGSQNTH